MVRGSSSAATRSRRNLRIRSETDLSSFSSSRRASGSNSILQAMLAHNFLERNGLHPARFNRFHSLLGQINVFQIVKMLKDGLAGVVSLGAAGFLGEASEALFDLLGKADG